MSLIPTTAWHYFRYLWGPLLICTALISSEWLFMATKLSFMSGQTYTQRLETWLAGLLIGLAAVGFSLLATALALGLLGPRGRAVGRSLVALVSAFLLACLLVLLADNFLYTLFELGIRSIESTWLSLTVLLFVVAGLLFLYRRFLATIRAQPVVPPAAGLVVLLAIAMLAWIYWKPAPAPDALAEGEAVNVLIIGVDALEARHMSAYGYPRRTTPFLDSRLPEFLVSEASYTNNSASWGSIGSLLTGKYPATTRLIFPPDVLGGEDQFQHLPGLLQRRGYRSLDMSLRWYTEARDMNMRCAFDEANFRRIRDCQTLSGLRKRLMIRFSDAYLLLDAIRGRITERLALLNPLIENPTVDKDLSRVGQPDNYWHRDDERVQRAIDFMTSDDPRPFLVNLHLMGLHGGKPQLDQQIFSAGKALDSFWDTDFYDDALLRLDGQLRGIFQRLEQAGKLDRTIVVVTSDHGKDWDISTRLPLMFRFPGAAPAGMLAGNTQRMDVAPTVLKALGMEVPPWMEGHTLVGDQRPDLFSRPIIQTSPRSGGQRHRGGRIMLTYRLPPFYSLGRLHIISCDYQFSWHLIDNTWLAKKISDRPTECAGKRLFRLDDFIELARNHLGTRGYDTSHLPVPRQLNAGDPSPAPATRTEHQ